MENSNILEEMKAEREKLQRLLDALPEIEPLGPMEQIEEYLLHPKKENN